jgi:hypothetical protein
VGAVGEEEEVSKDEEIESASVSRPRMSARRSISLRGGLERWPASLS